MGQRKQSKDKRRRTPLPKRCQICSSPSGPWTREDAYPEWLRRKTAEWCSTADHTGLALGWDPAARLYLEPVCERCQRLLNERFENPTHGLLIAMIDGLALGLTTRQQHHLAGWIAKTTFVLRMADGPPLSERRELRRYLLGMLATGMPSDNATVRLARLDYAVGQSTPPITPAEWSRHFYADVDVGHRMTFTELFCETLVGPRPIIESFVEVTKDDQRFLCLWPPRSKDAIWPPVAPLNYWALLEQAESWSGRRRMFSERSNP